MGDAFVPLAISLRAGVVDPENVVHADGARDGSHGAALPRDGDGADVSDPRDERATLFGDLARLRAVASDALERASRRLLAALANDVLARELALAPVDVAALVERLRADVAAEEPLVVLVAPADAERIACGAFPIRIDAALAPGDVVLEVRDGRVESRFGFRLDAAVRAASAP